MSTDLKFTCEQYEEMIRLGLFDNSEAGRFELIYGEIVPRNGEFPMSPINPPHEDAVDELTDWSMEVLPRGAVRLRVQNSIAIPKLESQPEPDIVWLAPGRYRVHRPEPDQVLLLIEVSDSTLAHDRKIKARLYAEAGIRDYWVVNIRDRCIEVHRNPIQSIYRDVTTDVIGQDVRPLAFPDVILPVARIFPD